MDLEMQLSMRLISSLEKVFSDEPLRAPLYCSATALRGETFSFQLALRSSGNFFCGFDVTGDLPVRIREVRSVPCEMPNRNPDDYVLREAKPGLYPDWLDDLAADRILLPQHQWHALWVTVEVPKDAPAGKHTIKFVPNGVWYKNDIPVKILGDTETEFTLEVLPVTLPAQTLKRVEWFHVDCLYSAYHTECWSEKHWELIGQYAANAARHGINMLYVPLWTAPLDTAVGGERPTVQLLDIELDATGKYHFDFAKLKRYVKLLQASGIEYFEVAHPFTQWGAEFTPKIVVKVNGKEEKLFGWHKKALSKEYRSFLTQLMPQFLAVMTELGVGDKCYFHISDEPGLQHLEQYKKCAELIRSLIGGRPIVDALSNYDFYATGAVELPIPANNHIEDFYGKVPELWTYYCVSQSQLVPNRFMCMESARNRIMGLLMYRYDVKGFLQWGFNFYYSSHSRLTDLDVFRVTDSDRTFSSGDAFMVYPGKKGPQDSIRHEIFTEGLQDMRAMQALEAKIGRQAALDFLRESVGYDMTMTRYPRTAEWLTSFRERLNRALAK